MPYNRDVMKKLADIMDLSKVGHSGTPLGELLQQSLDDLRAQTAEPQNGGGQAPIATGNQQNA